MVSLSHWLAYGRPDGLVHGRLYAPQGNQRVDTRSTTGGNDTGKNANKECDSGYNCKGKGIGFGHAPDLAGEEMSQKIAGDEADGSSGQNQTQAVLHNQLENLLGLGAECHTNADFVGLHGDRIGNDAEHTNCDEKEGDCGKDTESEQEKAGTSVVVVFQKSGDGSGL